MTPGPLALRDLVAFIGTTSLPRARAFYGTTLALPLVGEDAFALVFATGGSTLRVTRVEQVTPAPYTVLGWTVSDIAGTVRQLAAAGVPFERYPGMTQDELGVWNAPGGAQVAWFKDPDGNTLSLTQLPAAD